MKKREEKHVFHILCTNPEYLIWFAYILIASSSFFIGLINNGIKEFESGSLYFISMSIIAPLFIDFLIFSVEIKKFQQKYLFLTRKTITLGICVLILFLCFIFLVTALNTNIYLQIILFISSIVLSLYMFCLNKLHFRYEEYKQLDDTPYHSEINQQSKKLSEQKNNVKITNNEGKEIKL